VNRGLRTTDLDEEERLLDRLERSILERAFRGEL
jgi:hypothetical protein